MTITPSINVSFGKSSSRFIKTDKKVDLFIKDEARNFYIGKIDELLKNYEPGLPKMKPDVLEQIIEIEERRRKDADQNYKNWLLSQGQVVKLTMVHLKNYQMMKYCNYYDNNKPILITKS